jgi:hypothetical protein
MRIPLALILAVATGAALAQSTARPRPPGTTALEAPPPMPAATDIDPSIESRSEVTTRTEGDQTIQEYRVKGKLFMMRVTPKHGRSYVLVDHKGDGQFARADSLDFGVRVPQWVLLEF